MTIRVLLATLALAAVLVGCQAQPTTGVPDAVPPRAGPATGDAPAPP